MQWWDLAWQVTTIFLFAIALSLTMYFLEQRNQWYFFVSAFATWVCMGAALTIYLNNTVRIEPDLNGWLIPANNATPEYNCPEIPLNAVTIHLGNSVVWGIKFPIRVLRIGDKEFITINKFKDAIAISTEVYSRDHKIIAEIIDNEFHINPNNYFRRERPDKYTLIVYDQHKRPVLNVQFLNRRAIRILGIFNSPGRPEVVIREKEIRVGGQATTAICSGDNGGAQIEIS